MTATWRWFVPGRLEVFGKHTDYAGGHSLVGAVPRGITVTAEATDDGRVVAEDVGRASDVFESPIGPASGARQTKGWHRYIAAVIERLARNFPDANLSTRIEFESTLPRAAGISSSSALVIAMAEALIARGKIDETERWQQAIRTTADRAAYFACIENGASYGPLEGDSGVGTHGGSEDHAAILTSRAGSLQQLVFSPLRSERSVRMPKGWTFVVASTGVASRKGSDVRDAYNRAAELVDWIVSAWRARHPDDERPLGELVREASMKDLMLTADMQARLDHFIGEDARVLEAADAFARGDIERIGRLADASQRAATELLRNQLPETLELVADARREGAAAACGFGAGWGGSVWALIPADEADAFLERWLMAYEARHPQLSPEGFVSPPSDGLTRL